MQIMLKNIARVLCAGAVSMTLGAPVAIAQSSGGYDSVTFSSSGNSEQNRYGFGQSGYQEQQTEPQASEFTPPAPQYETVSSAQTQRSSRTDWSSHAQASQTYGTPPSYEGAPSQQQPANDPYSLGGTYVPPPSASQPGYDGGQIIPAQPQYQAPQAQPQPQPQAQPQPQPQAQQPQYQPAPQAQPQYQPAQPAPQPQVQTRPAPRQPQPQAQVASRPVQQAAPQRNTSDEYRLGPGDQLHITVFGHEDLSGPRTVDGSGYIAMPLVDRIRAQGLSPRQLEVAIKQTLSPDYLRDPRVSVEVLNYRPFTVIGEVARPGRYPYAEGLTVIEAIALAGDFTYRASKGSVKVRRFGESKAKEVKPSTFVLPGDVITVPDRGLF